MPSVVSQTDRRRVGAAVDADLLGLARRPPGFWAARRGGRGSLTRSRLGEYQMRRWSDFSAQC